MSLDYSKSLIPVSSRSKIKSTAGVILAYNNLGTADLFNIYEALYRRFDSSESKGDDSYFTVTEFRKYLNDLKLSKPSTYQGYQGYQGIQGTRGKDGPQGYQGYQGKAGTGKRGTQGLHGYQGYVGYQGAQGTQGIQGTTGTHGVHWEAIRKLLNAHGIDLVNSELTLNTGVFNNGVTAIEGFYER